MMKKFKINTDILVTIMITYLFLAVPFHRLYTYTLNQLYIDTILFNNKIGFYLWFSSPILAGIYFFSVLRKRYKVDKYDFLIFIFILLGLFSTFNAVDKEVAIFGRDNRYEGILSILAYCYAFLNAKNLKSEKCKKYLIGLLFTVGVIQVIYAILQVLTDIPVVREFSITYLASALSGNPNFFATYMIITLMISFCLYITTDKILYFLLSIIYFIGLVLANSTGPMLALIISIGFIAIVFRKNIKMSRLIFLSLILMVTFTGMNDLIIKQNSTKLIATQYNISAELKDTAQKLSDPKADNTYIGNGRLNLWKSSLPLIKEYWLFGAGYDNFINVYKYNTTNLKYDKLHNVYLEIAICNGIPYFIVYMLICLIVFIKGIKIREPLYIGLFMAFVGYSIQAFANINVVEITWIYYFIMGLIIAKSEEYKNNKKAYN